MPARFRLREDRLRVISTAKSCAVKRTRQLLFRCNERTNWRNVQPVKRIDDRNGELGFMKSREMKHRSDGIIVTAQCENRMKSRPALTRAAVLSLDGTGSIYIFPMLLSTNISNRFKGIEIWLTLEIFIFYFYIIKKN